LVRRLYTLGMPPGWAEGLWRLDSILGATHT